MAFCRSVTKCFAGLLPKLTCSSISLLCSMNCQTLFLLDTDILLQPKVSNRDHAGYKEGDHVDLYIHRRPAIGGNRVSTVLSREWDLFHIPLHYSFSVGSIVPVRVALLNYLCNVLLSLCVAVVHCDAFPCRCAFFSCNSDTEHAGQV